MRGRVAVRLRVLIAALLGINCASTALAQELLENLLAREPFDEITVKDKDDNIEALQLELLDVPGRVTPPLKKTGKMEIRLLGAPDDIYEFFWLDIVKIRLYEDIMLDELNDLITLQNFDDAFDYFLFCL